MYGLEYVIAGVGGLGWLFRLEGRVTTQEKLQEARHVDLKELIESKFDGIDGRLGRIEKAMNGALGHE